jgi:transcriptional regulator with XRE-family HTH domain
MNAERTQPPTGKRPRRNYSKAELAYAVAVGRQIREHRVRLGLSAEKLAHSAGVALVTQFRREKGEMMVTAAEICRYAVIFGCQPSDLLPPLLGADKKPVGPSSGAKKTPGGG